MRSNIFCWFVLALLCCIQSSLQTNARQLTLEQKREAMIGWGFESFKVATEYVNNPSVTYTPSEPSDELFQLIADAMNEVKKEFSTQEIYQLFESAEQFMASGVGLKRLVEVIVEFYAANLVALPPNFELYSIWKSAKTHITQSSKYAIFFNGDEMELRGADLTTESMQRHLNLLRNLSKIITAISIKDVPLHGKEATAIQSMLHPKITSVSFENCQFVFTFNSDIQLDFSTLTLLTHFKCLNCDMKDVRPILESIRSERLIVFHLLNIPINDDSKVKLVNLLERQVNLQTLIIANSDNQSYDFPIITEKILQSASLSHLDLTGCAQVAHFNSAINGLSKSNLTELILAKTYFGEHFESFCKNFKKLGLLKHLNVTAGGGERGFSHLVNHINELPELKRLGFGCIPDSKELIDLSEKLRDSKVTIYRPDTPFLPVSASQLAHMENVDLFRLTDFNVDATSLDAVSWLAIDLARFPSDSDQYRSFFDKFKSLNALKITLNRDDKSNYLSQLLQTQKIRNLHIRFAKEFANPNEILEIIQDFSLKSLKLEYLDAKAKTNFAEQSFKADAVLWQCIESLDCMRLYGNFITVLIKKIKMPKLTTLECSIPQEPTEIKWPQMSTVRILNTFINDQSPKSQCKNLEGILKMFPSAVNVSIETNRGKIKAFNPTVLSKLRSLKIKCHSMINDAKFVENLSKLPFLVHLELQFENEENEDEKVGIHANFPSLIKSKVLADAQLVRDYLTS